MDHVVAEFAVPIINHHSNISFLGFIPYRKLLQEFHKFFTSNGVKGTFITGAGA